MKTLPGACMVAVLATLGLANPSLADAANDTVPAMVVLETLPVDPALAEGGLVAKALKWSATRIALQPARFARGAVIEK